MMLANAVLAFLLLLLEVPFNSSQSCSSKSETCPSKSSNDPSNRYSAESQKRESKWDAYIQAITHARASYTPCNRTDCGCISSRLDVDLRPWRDGISDRSPLLSAVKERRGVLYQVIRNQLYRSGDCRFPARCEGVEYFLGRILHQLPDLEFVLNDSDYPQMIHLPHIQPTPTPVFSFSKAPSDYNDILYPAWSFWAGGPAVAPLYPQGLGRWDEFRERLHRIAEENWPWERKESLGFFRGSRTSEERDPLILLSRAHPEIVDAAYTRNQAWKSDADTLYQPPAMEVSLEDHCRYKYLFNFRGVAASFRLRHLFLCRSAVFHVGDEWIEFFYDDLKPWVHYIPVRSSGEAMRKEVANLLEFAKGHDSMIREIAEAGATFIDKHLGMKHVECYWRRLLRRYARLLKYKVTLDSNMRHIK